MTMSNSTARKREAEQAACEHPTTHVVALILGVETRECEDCGARFERGQR